MIFIIQLFAVCINLTCTNFFNVAPFKWIPELTKLLTDELHQRDNSKVPYKKKMFQEITANLNKEKNFAITEIQVTNRYKTLLRGYRNVIENKKPQELQENITLLNRNLGR